MTQLKHHATPWGHESWVGPDGVHFSDYGCLEEAARTAPHDCDVPDCPGPVNKRKLDLFAELLGAAYFALTVIDAPDAPDSGASPILVLARQQLRAAIAKASPQAQ